MHSSQSSTPYDVLLGSGLRPARIPLVACLAERIARGSLELPMLPEVAGQVMAMASSERSSARDLADAIRRDASVAANVMRMANSPAFAARAPMGSLQQAIARLGIDQVRQIVIAISCQARVFRAQGYDAEVREAFRHSLATALFAKQIARVRRLNVEEAFLGGLLHDVGRPVLLQAVVDLEQELGIHPEQAHVEGTVERHHANVGADLARRWNLPQPIVELIRDHHELCDPVRHYPLLPVIGLADDLSVLATSAEEVCPAPLFEHPMLIALNLYPEDLRDLIRGAQAIRQTIEATT